MNDLAARIIAGVDARVHARKRVASLADEQAFEIEFGLGLEPVAVSNGLDDDFGTVGGEQTVAEVQDLLANWDARMADLNSAVNAFSGQWRAADQSAFDDFNRDFAGLAARYDKASRDAKSAISDSSWNPMPTSMIPAQSAYDNIMKAIRQCYPPDGCQVQKGDFDDLYGRLTAAKSSVGQPPPNISTIQPKAQDVDQQVLATTAPIDVIAQVTGQEAPQGPLSGTTKFLKWIYDHKNEVIIGAIVLAGGAIAYQFWTVIALPAKLAGGALKAAAAPAALV